MFTQARKKLTVWYLLIIMFVSLSFSFTIYRMLTNEIDRVARMQQIRSQTETRRDQNFREFRTSPPPLLAPEIITEFKQRLLISLGVINLLITAAAGAFGYFLAGRTLKPIKTMVDEQARFISDASHEFRTPLTALKSSLEVYLRGRNDIDGETRELIKDSIKDVDKMSALSDSLLQLAQYAKPNGNISHAAVPLDEVIKESVKDMSATAALKRIKIVYVSSDITVSGFKTGLSSLISILLDNAIKYSKENTTIEISMEKKDNKAIIKVKDEGIGIPEDALKNIFDRFYRVDTSRSDNNVSGFGLGLPIAKSIVKAHRGTLTVSSKEGAGSVFIVCLPVGYRDGCKRK